MSDMIQHKFMHLIYTCTDTRIHTDVCILSPLPCMNLLLVNKFMPNIEGKRYQIIKDIAKFNHIFYRTLFNQSS